MSPRSKKEYIEAIYLRYKNASRKQKNPILKEFCATLKLHRKHAIRLLKIFKRFRKTKTNKPGRAPFYAQPSILMEWGDVVSRVEITIRSQCGEEDALK